MKMHSVPSISRAFALFFAASLLFFACKPSQQAKRVSNPNQIGLAPLEFEALSIKSKLRLEVADEETKATAHIRIRKDSAIWLSVSKTNVEGIRVLVTPDSFMMVDRVNKTYRTYSYPELRERFKFSFDYQMLQSALTGEPYFPNGLKKAARRTPEYRIFEDLIGGIILEQSIGRKNEKLAKIEAVDSLQQKLAVSYDAFEDVEGQLMPHHNVVTVDYVQEGAPMQSMLDLEYTRINFADASLKLPFKINSKYEKVD